MQTIVSSVLLATTVGGLTPPTPIDWTRTPTGPENAVLYKIEQAGDSLWSVGINLEPGPQGTLKFHPLAIRWDGKTWQQTEQPLADGRLDDVLVRSADDVWAVGATEMIKEPMRPVLQHWQGNAWTLLEPPPNAADENAQFTTIAADGADLLIGRTGDESSVLRYADGTWQELPRDGLQHLTYIDNLVVISPKEIWAAGSSGLAKYDGTRWHKIELPVAVPPDRSLDVHKLVVKGPDDIWAVGMKNHQELWRRPMALHFDGKTWTEFGTPVVTGQFHDLEFLDGKVVAIGGDPSTGAPLVAELVGEEFVLTTAPPGAGYLHGSVQTGKCLWTVGVAAEKARYEPFIAIGKHRPDAGHGLPRPGC